jgi:hypothetical protein
MLRLLLSLLAVAARALPAVADPKKKMLPNGQGPDGVHQACTHEYDADR